MLMGQDIDMKSMVDVMKSKSDLYIDVIENVYCVMNASVASFSSSHPQAAVMNSSIEGTIKMRNQLEGRPRFHVQLNDNIVVGRDATAPAGALQVDDMNFHPSVDIPAFEKEHCLHLTGPEGEFTAMNYRSTHSFFPPVSVQPVVEQVSEYKLDVVLKVTTNFSAELKCSELLVSFRTPRTTSSCKCELPGEAKKQTTDYLETKRLVAWRIADAEGQHEFFLHVIITLTEPCNAWTVRSMGPIAWAMAGAVTRRLNFTIMNMSLSGMAVRDVKVDKLSNDPSVPEALASGGEVMCRNQWIRYIVKSSSYVCRFCPVC